MALKDIRNTVPEDAESMLLPNEKVYYYGSGSGCLGGSKSYIVVTDSRVVGTAIEPSGCLGGGKTSTVDIPLEHISSTRTETTGGCLGLFSTQTVVVSSGTADNAFATSDAREAARVIQQARQEAKGGQV